MSCRDDLSTLDVNKIAGVAFDTTGMSSLSSFQFEHLVVNPKLKAEGLQEANLKYEWKLKSFDGIGETLVLGTEKNLDYEVRLKPNPAGKFYQIVYTVTDMKTGLDYIMAWRLVVKNNIGEGLVIAENDGGQSSDLSHIMSPLVTRGFTGESVKHHVYSAINGSVFPGLITQMRFTTVYGVDMLYAITASDIYQVATLDYTFAAKNDDLFYGHTGDFKPQLLAGVYQSDIFAGNGKLYSTYLGAARKYGLPFDTRFTVPAHIGFNAEEYGANISVNFYDEVNGQFVYQPSVSSFGDRNQYAVPYASGMPFDPVHVAGKINLAAGNGANHEFLHVLKDKTSGDISLYVFTPGGYDDVEWVATPPVPLAVYNISAAPDIQNAKFFVFAKDQKVMYYATSSKIYAMLYSTATPVFQEKYSAPAGEQITTLQLYEQAQFLYNSYTQPDIATNQKQLIMSTYGTEGKVYIMPMINPGTGNIDQARIKTFGGFGHITAITAQK